MRHVVPATREWPTQLDDLDDGTPPGLWLLGEADLRMLALRSVAVVGCRNATAYGVALAGRWAAELVSAGWTVVSGAAFGIDAAAHRGALAAGGPTIAVMAGGVDVAVPLSHAGLIAEIADSGMIVSEYPPGTPARRHSFLQRNRVIASLTRATLVVEAAQRSGALNTANWAHALGRGVLAVPGPADAPTSRGTHRLIREGSAVLVRDVDDVLEQLHGLAAR